MKHTAKLIATFVSLWALTALAEEVPSEGPKPIPATRPEMKVALEALKDRQPRIPLPGSTEGQAGYLPEAWGGGGGLGGFRQFNNFGAPGRRGQNPDYKLDNLLTDQCFWVVSRGNNCQYCLGHQELKLRADGVDDNAIAALDTNWNRFDPRKQLALSFARKLTLEPDAIGDTDIANLKELFSDPEIIELAFTIAVFNSVNRWTDGMGFPQERHESADGELTFTTPTSQQYQDAKSIVVGTTPLPREALPAIDQIRQAIEAVRARTHRVVLPEDDVARRELTGLIGDREPYQWERALTQLPWIGKTHVATWNTILADDHLTPRLKAELALVTALHNRAWYAAAHAAHRLRQLGMSKDDLAVLIDEQTSRSDAAAAAHQLAAKSTTDPHLITDADIARVRETFSDVETAQIVHVISLANLFDRFTEALGLPLENNVASDAFSVR